MLMYCCVYSGTGVLVITVSIAAGLLVMVSSELVVLLIVCVGINTGLDRPGELANRKYMYCHKSLQNRIKTVLSLKNSKHYYVATAVNP